MQSQILMNYDAISELDKISQLGREDGDIPKPSNINDSLDSSRSFEEDESLEEGVLSPG